MFQMNFQTLSISLPSVLCSANARLMAWLIWTDERKERIALPRFINQSEQTTEPEQSNVNVTALMCT